MDSMFLMDSWSALGKNSNLIIYIKLYIICFLYRGLEIINGAIYGVNDEGSGLTVLRTFRLCRILKLVRFFPGLQRQLLVMLRTMDNVVVFFGLLSLFIFIFR